MHRTRASPRLAGWWWCPGRDRDPGTVAQAKIPDRLLDPPGELVDLAGPRGEVRSVAVGCEGERGGLDLDLEQRLVQRIGELHAIGRDREGVEVHPPLGHDRDDAAGIPIWVAARVGQRAIACGSDLLLGVDADP